MNLLNTLRTTDYNLKIINYFNFLKLIHISRQIVVIFNNIEI